MMIAVDAMRPQLAIPAIPQSPAIPLRRRGRLGFLEATQVISTTKTPRFKVFVQIMSSSQSKEVKMVDPNEAKRLAIEQMKQMQAKALFKRQRAVEAFNGGWAVLGLTIGIVIEGYTGNTILSQIALYLHLLADAMDSYFP